VTKANFAVMRGGVVRGGIVKSAHCVKH